MVVFGSDTPSANRIYEDEIKAKSHKKVERSTFGWSVQ